VHVVKVGGPSGLVYSPNRIDAKPNDIVSFQFLSKNHTATQSTFDAPCRKTEFTTSNVGFDSGFQPATDAAPVVWNVTVNDTAPIWVYCRQATHCGAGMVFAINSVESGANNFAAFQATAKGSSASGSSNSTTANSTAAAGGAVSSGARIDAKVGFVGMGTMGMVALGFALLV